MADIYTQTNHRLAMPARLLGGLAGLVLAAMTLVTLFDVGRRFLFNAPLFGTSEFTGLCLALITVAGLALLALRNDHISVSLFDGFFEARAPRLFKGARWLANVVGMGFLLWVIWDFAVVAAETRQRTVILDWPMAYLGWALLMSSVAGVVFALFAISRQHNEGLRE
ncbi:TRAP transporter small permease [Halomonas sp. H5]|uniref:TRAP transporter small permease n=1 Tax=Halomonas sp. H5 TaxID=3423910 RepID=UPI003D36866C